MSWSFEIPTRSGAIADRKAKGGKVAAVFPIHYPRPLFEALDALPVEVWGPPGANSASADAHLQSYACSIARNGLSFILDGGLNKVDAILVPHCCDTLQGLGTILKDFVPGTKPVTTLYIPRGENEVNVEFLARELEDLGSRLSRIFGAEIDKDRLNRAIDDEDKAERLLAELLENRSSLSATNREFYRLVRSREYLPARAFAELAEKALQSEKGRRQGIPLLLSGVVPEPMELLDLLERLGADAAADDFLAIGRRVYPPSLRRDPWARMAESIVKAPPDSTRGSSVASRARHLIALAKKSGALGAIFWNVKFCEPEQFYLPQIEQELTKAGVRCLALEVELGDAVTGPVTTRVEAFLEMLR